jgi:hypothetical protein
MNTLDQSVSFVGEKAPIESRAFRELCSDYVRNDINKLSWNESKTVRRIMKTYILPLLGDLDVCQVTRDSMMRSYEEAMRNNPSDAAMTLDLIMGILWKTRDADSTTRNTW